MPWEVKKQGSGDEPFKVIKSDTGRVVSSHETRKEAEAHVKALYANADEDGEEKSKGRGRNRESRNQGPTKPPPNHMRDRKPPVGKGGGARGPAGRGTPPGAGKRTPVAGARRRLQR